MRVDGGLLGVSAVLFEVDLLGRVVFLMRSFVDSSSWLVGHFCTARKVMDLDFRQVWPHASDRFGRMPQDQIFLRCPLFKDLRFRLSTCLVCLSLLGGVCFRAGAMNVGSKGFNMIQLQNLRLQGSFGFLELTTS